MTKDSVESVGASELRRVLESRFPFGLSKYPDKPDPQHVMNKVVYSLIGPGPNSTKIPKFIAEAKWESVDERPFIQDKEEWNQESVQWLCDDLRTIFDPDKAVFPSMGAPMAVTAGLATSDPNDEGLGAGLSRQLLAHDAAFAQRLADFLSIGAPQNDFVTRLARLVSPDPSSINSTTLDAHLPFTKWDVRLDEYANSVSKFVANVVRPQRSAQRLLAVQDVSRAMFLASTLMAFVPYLILHRRDANASAPPRIFVFGGSPPGEGDDRIVRAAARHFGNTLVSSYSGMAIMLSLAMRDVAVPSRQRQAERGAFVLNQLLIDQGQKPTQCKRQIDEIQLRLETVGVSLADFARTPEDVARAIVATSFSQIRFSQAIRALGKKVGFAGPDRGRLPRFLLETPLLSTLVRGLVPESGFAYSDFVDALRNQLGIVVGIGSARPESLIREVGGWASSAMGAEMLRDNETRLRERLVRAGLAQEFSDGHTEVTPTHA